MAEKYQSFEEFWPYYVGEHSKPETRVLHFIGTTFVFVNTLAAIVLRNGWYIAAIPVCAYGFAWFAHFFVEKNRPATFTYPLWSLRGDFRMYFLMLRGKMTAEIERLQRTRGSSRDTQEIPLSSS